MDNEKKSTLSEFSRRAMQRMQDKKVPKRQRLYVPSIDSEIVIRSLTDKEITECVAEDETDDSNRSDKYSIYLSVVEPDLRQTAREVMEAEAGLPPEQRTVLEPMDIVGIFDMCEITDISLKIMELSGWTSSKKVTVVTQLKN